MELLAAGQPPVNVFVVVVVLFSLAARRVIELANFPMTLLLLCCCLWRSLANRVNVREAHRLITLFMCYIQTNCCHRQYDVFWAQNRR